MIVGLVSSVRFSPIALSVGARSLSLFLQLLLVGAHHLDELGVLGRCQDNLNVHLCLAVLVLLQRIEEFISGAAALLDKPLNVTFQHSLVLFEHLSVPVGSTNN